VHGPRVGKISVLLTSVVIVGCSRPETTTSAPTTQEQTSTQTSSDGPETSPPTSDTDSEQLPLADVKQVTTQAETWSIEIASPDTGCEQYANWWEVVTPEGTLVYRRILAHSHVDEQPFTRGGGPVEVDPGDTVIVRAHMFPGGYGGQALRGSIDGGFEVDNSIDATFAPQLAESDPLPDGCAF